MTQLQDDGTTTGTGNDPFRSLAPLPPSSEKKEGEVKESPWTLSPSRILHDVPMRSMLACVALSRLHVRGSGKERGGTPQSVSLSCPFLAHPTDMCTISIPKYEWLVSPPVLLQVRTRGTGLKKLPSTIQ